MSYEVLTVIKCDKVRCRSTFHGKFEIDIVRLDAIEEGWIYDPFKGDFCPMHTDEETKFVFGRLSEQP